MRPFRRILTYVAALPNDLLWAWPSIILIRILWGHSLHWEQEALVCQLKRNSWPARTWYRAPGKRVYKHGNYAGEFVTWGGTTLGHAIFYGPHEQIRTKRRLWTALQIHEHVHVEQCEAAQLRALLTALPVGAVIWHLGHLEAALWTAGALWATGYLTFGLGGWLTAWLRGEDPYRGSHHEEAAYAIDRPHRHP